MVPMIAAVLFACTSCSGTRTPHPTTKEEFSEAFKKAFEEGDRQTIGSWVLWGDIPKNLRSTYVEVFTAFAGKNKVVSISIEKYDPKYVQPMVEQGRQIHFSATPVYWFTIETAGNAGFEGGKSSSSLRGALGYDNGKLYFCGPIVEP